uniref:Uncharacterized protein n=1 Tax=Anguilla anguilla TaxID=7936 RepID=A0A0E9T5V5_ANGAN
MQCITLCYIIPLQTCYVHCKITSNNKIFSLSKYSCAHFRKIPTDFGSVKMFTNSI